MIPPKDQFMQIINVNKNYWIALSTVGCQTACIIIFDSSGGKELPKSTLMLISDLLQTQEKLFSVELVDFQMLEGSCDCGLFTVAFITSIYNGQVRPSCSEHMQWKSIFWGVLRMEWWRPSHLLQVDILRHLSGRISRFTVFADISMMAPKWYNAIFANSGSM